MNAVIPESDAQAVARRAARERKRGHHRKAMLLLRRAAFEAADSPGLWNRYALSCQKEGLFDEARKAFAQSLFIDKRQGNVRRAEVTRELADRLDHSPCHRAP